jgi:curved DNA-binding protein CbpA
MANFEEIDSARKILRLSEEASIKEIREAFRSLSLKYHPDRCLDNEKENCKELFKKISHAKDLLEAYCLNYRYSFREKDIRKNTMSREEYEHLRKFYDGWIGDLNL